MPTCSKEYFPASILVSVPGLSACSNEVYYSNRAAAYTALKQYRWAMRDAKKVIALKPKWVKGWARLGAAHMGLDEFSEVQPHTALPQLGPVQ